MFCFSFLKKQFSITRISISVTIRIGDIIEPKRILNLNHSLFNGDKNLEFKTPKTKKTKDKIIATTQYPIHISKATKLLSKTLKKIPNQNFY